jgi:hypothetical protein
VSIEKAEDPGEESKEIDAEFVRQVRVQATNIRTHLWLTASGRSRASASRRGAGEYLNVTGVRLMVPLSVRSRSLRDITCRPSSGTEGRKGNPSALSVLGGAGLENAER